RPSQDSVRAARRPGEKRGVPDRLCLFSGPGDRLINHRLCEEREIRSERGGSEGHHPDHRADPAAVGARADQVADRAAGGTRFATSRGWLGRTGVSFPSVCPEVFRGVIVAAFVSRGLPRRHRRGLIMNKRERLTPAGAEIVEALTEFYETLKQGPE